MSKKKKKAKQKYMEAKKTVYRSFDNQPIIRESEIEFLNGHYKSIISEISEMNEYIKYKDSEAYKKERKRMLRNDMGLIPYYCGNKSRIKARMEVLDRMEKENFYSRVEKVLADAIPCCVIIAKILVVLITTILSFEPFKRVIAPSSMNKLNQLYSLATGLH